MQPIRRSIIVFAAAALIVGGPAALGSPREGSFRSKAAGPAYWGQPGAWEIYDEAVGWRAAGELDGVPGRGQLVTIQAGHTVVVSRDQQVGKLRIERGADGTGPGTLEITSGGMLTIYRALSMARRPEEAASARIVFSGSRGEPGVLYSEPYLGIYGDVEVVGAAGGVIQTARPTHLVSIGRHARLSATGGPLTIGGSIEMDGRIIADGPYTVTVNGARVSEGSSGIWRIAHPAAKVTFDTTEDIFLRSGTILIERGTLDVAANLKIAGFLTRKQEGQINVREGVAFDVRGRFVDKEGQQLSKQERSKR